MKRIAAFSLVLLALGAAGWATSGIGQSGILQVVDPSSTDTTTTDTTPTDTTPTTSTDTTTTDTTSTDTTTTAPPDNPPTFQNVPADFAVEANGPGGSVVGYTPPTAVDDNDGPRPVNCAPASGSVFPLGNDTVDCTASDTTGHQADTQFHILVRDTTPPTLLVPAPHTVYATSPQGVTDSNPAVIAFVQAPRATDIVDPNPVIGSDLHSTLPIGTTTIRFFARDFSGNTTTRDVPLTVLPQPPAGTPPLPGPVVGHLPGNVGKLTAAQGDGSIALSWQLPADCDHVVLSRSARDGTGEQVIYSGKATTFTDRGLQNGVEYRYVVRCVDTGGNRSAGVAVLAMPMQNRLRSPKDGARLRKPPKLTWAAEPDADYYNVQLFRNGTRILAGWPKKATFALKKTWKYQSRKYKLRAGTYTWYVWPGYGNRKSADYGALLGFRTFSIRQ